MTRKLNELEILTLTDLVSQKIAEIVDLHEPEDDAAAAEYLDIVAEDLRYYAHLCDTIADLRRGRRPTVVDYEPS